MVSGFSVHIYPILGALRTYGLLKDTKIVCTLDFIDLLYNGTSRQEIANIPFIAPRFEVEKTTAINAFRDRYKKRFGSMPGYVEAYAYDTGALMVASYQQKGKIDTTTIRSILPYNGITGALHVDDDGDLDNKLGVAVATADGVQWLMDPKTLHASTTKQALK